MKIVFNTDQVYLQGGIESVMAIKANYFVNLPDVEVYIVTTEQQDKPPYYTLDSKIKLIDLGVNYDRTKSYFTIDNLKRVFKHHKEQKKLFKKLKPDVIISPNYNFDHYWLPFIKGRSLLVKERHGSRYFEKEDRLSGGVKNKLSYLLNDWIDSLYNYIVVLNKDEKEFVQSSNAVVIPNPIELSAWRSSLENKCVVAAGRISPVKGFDDLIKSWAIVEQEYPDWQLHIYGQNYAQTQQELENIIDTLQLNNVVFKGSVSNMAKVMSDYSLYTMTSKTECFPMVLLEAKSVGLPIVSYDCPFGPRNIVKDQQDGVLVEQNNVGKFAEEVIKLIADKELRLKMGQNAIENVNQFAIDKVMKMWTNLLCVK